MQRTGVPCIQCGGTAGGQTTKRIGLFDLPQEVLDLIDQPSGLADDFKGPGFRGMAIRQAEHLLAVELPTTMGAVLVDSALSRMMSCAGLVKESLAAPFLDLQSERRQSSGVLA